jgi:hypothetical protein
MNLDFNKYKRIFAFGCSFTKYRWPTWADLISLECPNAIYRNYGMGGLGNLAISTRIIEGSRRFRFDSDDLVLVMWSTFCREDRWIEGKWFAQGNVYYSEYPKEWIKKYVDPNGGLIRDHALIYSTNRYLESLGVDSIVLKSAPFAYSEFGDISDLVSKELEVLYKKDYDSMPIDLYTYIGSDWCKDQQKYLDDWEQEFWRNDSHPFSGTYVSYLKHMGINLSDSTLRLANEWDNFLKTNPRSSEMMKRIDFLRQNVDLGRNKIF